MIASPVRVVADLEKEASVLEAKIAELDVDDPADEIQYTFRLAV